MLSMKNLHTATRLLFAAAVFLFAAAAACTFTGNSLDIIFLGGGIFVAAACIRQFLSVRKEQKSRMY